MSDLPRQPCANPADSSIDIPMVEGYSVSATDCGVLTVKIAISLLEHIP